jgi:hypothetical protein
MVILHFCRRGRQRGQLHADAGQARSMVGAVAGRGEGGGKDRRLKIRLSSKDLEAIQKRALAEGLPYQTLIASLLHKYATGGSEKSDARMGTVSLIDRSSA